MDYKLQDISKIHVWIGSNFDENYEEYFELDYNVDIDIDAPEYKVCGFCQDIGLKWYDHDWITILQHDEFTDIDILLKELAVSKDVLMTIKNACANKEIIKANALFAYCDADILIQNKDKFYNKLSYIGVFESELGGW